MLTENLMRELTTPPNSNDGDHRRDAPAFHRNGIPILDALSKRLSQLDGHLLEIGSGSGQHTALLAKHFPRLTFWPSDPNPDHRASIDAWRAYLGLENVRPAADLDVRTKRWELGTETASRRFDLRFDAILSANVIHIAPWSVAEGLFLGGAKQLAPGGFLALYGPFRWRGVHVSSSNQAFDEHLRARDPAWGVRDIEDVDQLATSHQLARIETIAMPANNHLLVFSQEEG
ncbi:MAG: DUF938 domain-containing protein [Pseudomonadota bacterium]